MKKIIAIISATALALTTTSAIAAGDTGETPPGDPIEELAKLGCDLGLWWLCKDDKKKK